MRPQITFEANLTNREAVLGPEPYVKWSHEPPRPQDVPQAIARAIYHATLPPRGPAFVSIPMDDWDEPADEDALAQLLLRSVHPRALPDPVALEDLAGALQDASNPVLIAGPDIDAAGGWDAAVAARRQAAPAGVGHPRPRRRQARLPGGPPQLPRHPAPGHRARVRRPSRATTWCSWWAPRCSPTTPTSRARCCPTGTRLVQITSDPAEAARAPVGHGDRRATSGSPWSGCWSCSGPPHARRPSRARPPASPPASEPISGSAAMAALAEVWPQDGIAVVETPSSTVALRNRLRLSKPGSYYFSSSGGLGFGIAASVGVQLAQPERPVVCVLGEGSAQYGITALWTAANHRVPVTFLVLRNEEYMILKWFAELEQASGAPGLDLKGLDVASVAEAYGVPSEQVSEPEELADALRRAIAVEDGPRLVEVPVATGMWLE